MKHIVATIQKEQNAIIRDEKSDVLIIQGVAGSGKTSIALHRVAYLLYRLKNKIYSENMMIISPNKIFSDYISNVLPELGEEQILQMTFDDIAEHELEPHCEFQNLYAQTCELLENYDHNLIERIKFKSSGEFLCKLNEYIKYIEEHNFQPETFYYIQDEAGGYILEKPFEISDFYMRNRYEAYKRFPAMKRLEMIFDDIVDKMIDFYDIKQTKIRTITLKKRILGMFKSNNILDLYAGFYKYINCEDMYVPSTVEFNINNKGRAKLIKKVLIAYDDVAPVLYLKSAIFGADTFLYVKHLLVDEMQDYTPTHYAFFNKLFVCKKTILGDINQLVNPFNRSASQESLAEIYSAIPKTSVSTMTLLKSYRSTTEIVDFARRVIPSDNIQVIERHGDKPEIIKCGSSGEQAEKIIG
jgi:DNA helicase-2/ATP-dependent DNA helicase PcrA